MNCQNDARLLAKYCEDASKEKTWLKNNSQRSQWRTKITKSAWDLFNKEFWPIVHQSACYAFCKADKQIILPQSLLAPAARTRGESSDQSQSCTELLEHMGGHLSWVASYKSSVIGDPYIFWSEWSACTALWLYIQTELSGHYKQHYFERSACAALGVAGRM